MEAHDAAATEAIGGIFASCATVPSVFWLIGELGSGKTSFSRGFIRSLGYDGRVVSPTYTLMEMYSLDRLIILHLDLYRLTGPGELLETGVHEYLGDRSICLIEWPENAAGGILDADLRLRFDFCDAGRRIAAEADNDIGAAVLERVESQRGRETSVDAG